jgi:hypothetical protein
MVSLNLFCSVLICFKNKRNKVKGGRESNVVSVHKFPERQNTVSRNIVLIDKTSPLCHFSECFCHMFLLMPQNIVVEIFLVPVGQIPDSQVHMSGTSCRNALV